ncbi:MAG: YgaP family membrane protein [Saccharospirillum sp.]
MKANVGSLDRLLRIVVGAALILLALTGVIGWWGYIGVVLVVTGVVRVCPAYLPFGIRTNKK